MLSVSQRRMTSPEIDSAVLAVTEVHWRKVAMIILKTAQRLGRDLPEGDTGYSMIAARIAALVAASRLASQGDISRWRHSEVRLPGTSVQTSRLSPRRESILFAIGCHPPSVAALVVAIARYESHR